MKLFVSPRGWCIGRQVETLAAIPRKRTDLVTVSFDDSVEEFSRRGRLVVGRTPVCQETSLQRQPFFYPGAVWQADPYVPVRPDLCRELAPSISVFSLGDPELLDKAGKLILRLRDTREPEMVVEFLSTVLDRLPANLGLGTATRFSFVYSPPGQYSTTTHPNLPTGVQSGLHIDNFSGLGLAARHLAPRRLALNLGLEPRSLVFMRRSIWSMADACGIDIAGDAPLTGDDVRSIYTKYLSTSAKGDPVYKLSLAPAEGYLADTESFLHDGYTVGRTSHDLVLLMHQADGP